MLSRRADQIESLKEVIRLEPDNASAHYDLGSSYSLQCHHGEAIESRKHVIRLEPDNAGAHSGLGRNYSSLGRKEEAVEAPSTRV